MVLLDQMSLIQVTPGATNGQSTTIDVRGLAGPFARCILVAIILSTSTGILIRKLFLLTISDLAALTVGTIWALGDIVPCLSICLVIHDALVANDSGLRVLKNLQQGNPTLLDIIISIFCILYIIELVLVAKYLATSLDTDIYELGHSNTITKYRNIFFHFQIIVCIIYLLHRLRLANLKIRVLIPRFSNLFAFIRVVIQSLSHRLNDSNHIPDQIRLKSIESDHNIINPHPGTISLRENSDIAVASDRCRSIEQPRDDLRGERSASTSVSVRDEEQISDTRRLVSDAQTQTQSETIVSRTTLPKTRASQASKRIQASGRKPGTANRGTRGATNRRYTSTGAPRSSAIQIVRVCGAKTSHSRASARSVGRHRGNACSKATRTVNLNLNVS